MGVKVSSTVKFSVGESFKMGTNVCLRKDLFVDEKSFCERKFLQFFHNYICIEGSFRGRQIRQAKINSISDYFHRL